MKAPIDTLPNDVLSEIFKHTIGSYYPCGCMLAFQNASLPTTSPPEPWILGQVSKHWRRVSRATPRLWRLILIDIAETTDPAEVIAEQDKRIQLSGNVPLILVIAQGRTEPVDGVSSSEPEPFNFTTFDDACVDFMCRHASRWSEIYAMVPWWSKPFDSHSASFTQLTKLATTISITSLNDVLPPTLSSFGSMQVVLRPHGIPWAGLTTFEGLTTSSNDIFYILQEAPRLKYVRFLTMQGLNHVQTPPGKTIHLPQLVTFDVMNVINADLTTLFFLSHIRAPNLKVFRWSSNAGYRKDVGDALTTFLRVSKCSLDALLVCNLFPHLDPQPSDIGAGLRKQLPMLEASHVVIAGGVDAGDFHALWTRCESALFSRDA